MISEQKLRVIPECIRDIRRYMVTVASHVFQLLMVQPNVMMLPNLEVKRIAGAELENLSVELGIHCEVENTRVVFYPAIGDVQV